MSSPSERAGKMPATPCSVSEPLVADAGQQGLGVGEDLARLGALFGMVENLGVTPLESPRREEETPVDERFGVGHVEVGEDHAVPCGAARRDLRCGAAPRRAAARIGDRGSGRAPVQPARRTPRAGPLLVEPAPRRRRGRRRGRSSGRAGCWLLRARVARVDRPRADRAAGAIFTAVWRSEVVAPPMMTGMRSARRSASSTDAGHFVERRGDQAAQADRVGAPCGRFVDDALRLDHDAQVADLVAVAGHDHRDDVFADVVDVALDRGA